MLPTVVSGMLKTCTLVCVFNEQGGPYCCTKDFLGIKVIFGGKSRIYENIKAAPGCFGRGSLGENGSSFTVNKSHV